MSDRLHVLIIDDETQSLLASGLESIATFDFIREPDDGHDLMLATYANQISYDIVLADVNFKDSSIVRSHLERTRRRDEVVPLGPILAMPFLTSGDLAFVPYSSYWGDKALEDDLAATTTLGFLEAQVFGRPVRFRDIHKNRAALVDGKQSVGNAPKALEIGLRKLRQRLFSNPHRLRNLADLYARLNKSDEARAPEFFRAVVENRQDYADEADAMGGFHLHVAVGGVRVRQISLGALYADWLIGSFDPVYRGPFDVDGRWASVRAEMIRDIGEALRDGGPDVGRLARHGAALIERTDLINGDTPSIKTAIADADARWRNDFPELEEGHVLRAAVLCAWVKAWKEVLDDVTRKQRLIPRVREILGLLEGPATMKHHRLFADTSRLMPLPDRYGHITWSLPYYSSATGIARWLLDRDAPADLSSADVELCQTFAALPEGEGGLDWPIDDVRARGPAWMH